MSKRKEKSDERAQRVCRELRHLVVKDGMADKSNATDLVRLLESWMNVTGNIKYDRPKIRKKVNI